MTIVDRKLTRPNFHTTRRERMRAQILREFCGSSTQTLSLSVDAATLSMSAPPMHHRCGVLSDGSIIEAVESGLLGIEPFDIKYVQPAGYDLVVALDEPLTLEPFVFHRLATKARFRIPRVMKANVQGRSSIARLGVLIHFTAGNIDPGFPNPDWATDITFEVMAMDAPVTFLPGDRIAQMEFLWLDQPCMNPYKGRYRDQRGPTESRFKHGDD